MRPPGSWTGRGPILPTWRTQRTPSRYSDGPLAGRLIARKTGKVTTRWQQYVLDVALERVDGPGSPWAYSTVDLIVGRRAGKTIVVMGVPLVRALMGPVTMDNGAWVPFTGAHTAQNLVKARQRFMKDLVEPYQASMSPEVWAAGQNLRAAIGDTSLTLDPAVNGKDWRSRRASSIQVFAPTLSAVRGDGLLHLGFDEVLVFTAQRGQELMAAARPTLASMRGHGQVWRTSNVTTLNDERTWLYALREKGRQAVQAGVTAGSAYFEFAIPEDEDPLDEETWWRYHPALGDNLLRPEELRVDLGELGPHHFAAEYLGRWPGRLAVQRWAAIMEADFEAAATTDPLPAELAATVAVDIDPFGRSATIAAAVTGPGGDVVEVLDHRPGSEWVWDALTALAPMAATLAVDDYGPGHDLVARLAEVPAYAGKLLALRSPDVVAACYTFEAGLREGTLRWRASDYHQALRAAASAAERTPGRSWQWERRVSVTQTPLVAVTLARWGSAHRAVLQDSAIF
jgi:hypothetical protein